ncbi:MAG TPA: CBS domain-containing protein [Halothiobacillus sp.]|nr:CBS domain-containing protein [Halothiobacillus sp.]
MMLSAILKNKPANVISVDPETSITNVVKLLGEKRIGAVLVIDAHDKLVGILSERDIVRTLNTHSAATLNMTAAQLMTHSPTVTSPEATVVDAMQVMTDGRFRHLPVVSNGKLVGLVSIGDVVKARIDQQAHEVDSLRAYVVGAVA